MTDVPTYSRHPPARRALDAAHAPASPGGRGGRPPPRWSPLARRAPRPTTATACPGSWHAARAVHGAGAHRARRRTPTATGSGWVVRRGATSWLTNAHVVNEGDALPRGARAGAPDGAEVVAAAPCEDLALLRVGGGDRDRCLARAARLRRERRAGRAPSSRSATARAPTLQATRSAPPPASSPWPARPSATRRPTCPPTPPSCRPTRRSTRATRGGPLADLDGRVIGDQLRRAHAGLRRPAAAERQLRDLDRPAASGPARAARRAARAAGRG